jgi:hypothetical protein
MLSGRLGQVSPPAGALATTNAATNPMSLARRTNLAAAPIVG